jgi:hypothetical protein
VVATDYELRDLRPIRRVRISPARPTSPVRRQPPTLAYAITPITRRAGAFGPGAGANTGRGPCMRAVILT